MPTKSHPAIETIKARVQERVEAANLSRNEASRCAGLGLSYVNDLLAGKSKKPSRESLAKLGDLLDTDVGYFLGEQDEPRKGGTTAGSSRAPVRTNANGLPLYRVGLTDQDGFFKLDETRKSPVTLPIYDDGVYCVSVPDDTMAPRYRAGEIVVVNPMRPVTHGGFALVKQTDGRVAIREVVSIAPDKIVVKTLDGGKTTSLTRQQVSGLERIVAGCEQS